MIEIGSTKTPRSTPDQRILLAWFVSYTAWLLLVDSLIPLGILVVLIAGIQAFSSPAPHRTFRRWIGAVPAAIIIAAVYWAFSATGGKVIFSIWGKPFGVQGLFQGVFFAVRFLGFLLGGFLVYSLSTPEKLSRAVLWFCSPLRHLGVPIHMVYYVVWFAIRTIPVLVGESNIVRLSQQARGARPAGMMHLQLSGTQSFIIPVFAAAVRRADGFALALQARGFDPATCYRKYPLGRLRPVDGLWLAGLAAAWAIFLI